MKVYALVLYFIGGNWVKLIKDILEPLVFSIT